MIQSAKIEPIEGKKDFYLLRLTLWEHHGKSEIQLICSMDTLNQVKHEVSKALGEKRDYSNLPDNLRKFMEQEDDHS